MIAMRASSFSIFLVISTSVSRAQAGADKGGASGDWFADILIVAIAIGLLVGLGSIKSGLANSTWSLADALSEEADVSLRDAGGQPAVDKDGKSVIGSELRASTSRLIALLGLVAILAIYIGFGLVVLRDFAQGRLPESDQFTRLNLFMFSGVTMFAPYIVNKFSSIFDWLKPSPKS